jgi:hypothetical protein
MRQNLEVCPCRTKTNSITLIALAKDKSVLPEEEMNRS